MSDIEFITLDDVAKMLHVKKISVLRYTKRKVNPLPYYRINDRNYLVKKEDFDRWMESRFVK